MGRNQSYSSAVEASVALFENALSVLPEVLHGHSSIISVRALLLMVSLQTRLEMIVGCLTRD